MVRYLEGGEGNAFISVGNIFGNSVGNEKRCRVMNYTRIYRVPNAPGLITIYYHCKCRRRSSSASASRHINNMFRIDFRNHEYETCTEAAARKCCLARAPGTKFFKLDEYIANVSRLLPILRYPCPYTDYK